MIVVQAMAKEKERRGVRIGVEGGEVGSTAVP